MNNKFKKTVAAAGLILGATFVGAGVASADESLQSGTSTHTDLGNGKTAETVVYPDGSSTTGFFQDGQHVGDSHTDTSGSTSFTPNGDYFG